ncbi:hypothetical protein PVAND_003129 [Polypedilum vanderplanki]|uniref:Tudor domain-containing protein n=1 Tax=Polypedilum vanderplanki TaxID=319348 RepID=A0A9J6BT51_POLVA|nr:hypothetical protein PVAND_003129 [Polypedilum vanderplanki]
MMNSSKKASLYQVKITKIEQFLEFIKITAQNLNDLNYIQLSTNLESIFKSAKALKDEELELGETYIAKIFNDSDFQRCRILDSDDFSSVSMVDFIDLGSHGRVKYNDLRAFPENSELKSLPPISKEFILGELYIFQNDPYKIKKLEDLITNKFATMQITGQNETEKIVELYFAQSSFVRDIVMKHPILNTAFKLISLKEQLEMLNIKQTNVAAASKVTEISKVNYPLPQEFFEPNGCDVIISAYERGPKDFYVQLNGSLEKYQNLNIKLRSDKASLKHTPFPKVNELYAAVIEYNSVERAMVLRKMSDSLYLVRLVDYGSKRIINVAQICELPNEFKIEPFAWKFALSNVEELNHLNMSELNFYFFYITRDKKLRLHVNKKAEERGEPNLCSLFDGNMNILARIKNFNPRTLKYPVQVPLQIGTTIKARVSSLESSKTFYIIKDNITPPKLFEELEIFTSCRLENPKKDNVCCLLLKGKSYRGIVLKRLSSFAVTCQLVDTGRIDDFTAHEVKIMIEKFTKLPPKAYKCSLYGFDDKKLGMFSKSLKDICNNNQAFNVTVKEFKDGIYYVKLETEDKKDVLEEIMKVPTLTISPARRSILQPQRSNSFRNSPANRKILEPLKLSEFDWNMEDDLNDSWSSEGSLEKENSNKNMAVITSVQSPNDFVIQLIDSIPKMNEFFNELQKLGEQADPLTAFEKSEMCLIKNPYTKQWCRTMIIDSTFDQDKIEIKLKNVDDGVIYTVDDATVLKKYPFQCLTVVNFGIRCSLPVKISKKNLNEATEVMIHLIGKNIQYELICANEIANIIDVKVFEGKRRIKSLIYELVKSDLAIKLEYIPGGFALAQVVHIENLSEFYIILDKDKGIHEQLMSHLQFFERKPLQCLKINRIIMAMNGINKQWERAQIIGVKDDEVEVKFIDHGSIQEVNIDETAEMCHNESWDPFAMCCSIYMPKNVDPKTIAAVELFKEIAKERKIFGVKMMKSTRKCSVVQLMLEGTGNIGEKIMEDFGNKLISLCDTISNATDNSSESSIMDDDDQ